jgi:hypothetical protein
MVTLTRFYVVFLSLSSLLKYSDQDMTVSFHILSSSLFTNNPAILLCIVIAAGSAVKRAGTVSRRMALPLW